VGNWPAAATVKSLAAAGQLSTAAAITRWHPPRLGFRTSSSKLPILQKWSDIVARRSWFHPHRQIILDLDTNDDPIDSHQDGRPAAHPHAFASRVGELVVR